MRAIRILFMAILLAVLVTAGTSAQTGVTLKPVLQTGTTATGEPIQFPLFRNEFTVVTIDIAPGGRIGRHMHPVPLIVYVIQGDLTVEEDGRPARTYKAGDAFAEVVGLWHDGLNRGSIPVRVVVVFAGEQGKPVLVRP